jgi:hypothetical protein
MRQHRVMSHAVFFTGANTLREGCSGQPCCGPCCVMQVESSGPSPTGTSASGVAFVPSSTILQVVKAAVLAPYGHKGREVHRIPLVQQIVPLANAQARTLLIDPPPGQRVLQIAYSYPDSICVQLHEVFLKPFSRSCLSVKGTGCVGTWHEWPSQLERVLVLFPRAYHAC